MKKKTKKSASRPAASKIATSERKTNTDESMFLASIIAIVAIVFIVAIAFIIIKRPDIFQSRETAGWAYYLGGKVVERPTAAQPTESCKDNDDGKDYLVKGIVSGFKNSFPFSSTDFCVNDDILKEYYCANENPEHVFVSCKALLGKTCYKGACI